MVVLECFSTRLDGLRGFFRMTSGVVKCFKLAVVGVDGQVSGCNAYVERDGVGGIAAAKGKPRRSLSELAVFPQVEE